VEKPLPTIAVLGASGLIGEAVATQLMEDGFPVVAIARRFHMSQKAAFGEAATELPLVPLDAGALSKLIRDRKVEILVNCVGALRSRHGVSIDALHRTFVERLVAVLRLTFPPSLLIHISIPGAGDQDRTAFSRTKPLGESAIIGGFIPFVILRPGFVVATAAYGGGALIRALAALPFDLPSNEARQVFATTDVRDVSRTIAVVAHRWSAGERAWQAVWDVMAREPTTVGEVIEAFRHRFGGPTKTIALPRWLLTFGAEAGETAALLGWSPPIQRTTLCEMRRGITGRPEAWIAATGIEPISLGAALRSSPATIQEKWFARLYLLKGLVLGSLAVFWILSGLLPLTVSFQDAIAILTRHGLPEGLAQPVAIASSLADIAIGAAIAARKTCRGGLLAGIVLSLCYLVGATIVAPDLWIGPLGALVKTVPAILLMLVGLATLESR
jgi:nucleoside-diphosphate-sugar epimerase